MKPIEIIAIIEGITICILLILISFRKIGRPLTEIEIQTREQRKADKIRKKQEEEIREYEQLEELEKIAKSLVRPIKIMSYNYDRNFIYYAHFSDSRGVMLNVEKLMFDIYEKNPCPTVYALVRSCGNKNIGDTIN